MGDLVRDQVIDCSIHKIYMAPARLLVIAATPQIKFLVKLSSSILLFVLWFLLWSYPAIFLLATSLPASPFVSVVPQAFHHHLYTPHTSNFAPCYPRPARPTSPVLTHSLRFFFLAPGLGSTQIQLRTGKDNKFGNPIFGIPVLAKTQVLSQKQCI